MSKANYQKLQESEIKLAIIEKFLSELHLLGITPDDKKNGSIKRLVTNYKVAASKERNILKEASNCIVNLYPPSEEKTSK